MNDSTGVVKLNLGDQPGKGRTGVVRMTGHLLATLARERFDLVHICLPSPIYAPLAAILSRLPSAWRPRVTLNVIDCTLAQSLETPPPHGTYERQVLDAHRFYAQMGPARRHVHLVSGVYRCGAAASAGWKAGARACSAILFC